MTVTVYVDEITEYGAEQTAGLPGTRFAHLTADTLRELLDFAQLIRLNPAWLQKPNDPVGFHFDLTPGKREHALTRGAKPVTKHELGQILARRRKATELARATAAAEAAGTGRA